MRSEKIYTAQDIQFTASAGTYTKTLAANLVSIDKTAADTTQTLSMSIPRAENGPFWQEAPKVVAVSYSIATAALDAAPTAVLNKVTLNASTKVTSRAATTQTLTFAGTNTVGTAVGTYEAIVTVTTPTTLAINEQYTLELTFDTAATTALKIWTIRVEYA